MPRALPHLIFGALAAASASYLEQRQLAVVMQSQSNSSALTFSPSFGRIFRSALLGGLGGALPDRLEPADTPNHRKFFHSLVVGFGVAEATRRVLRMPPSNLRSDLLALLSGYGSHLVADAFTPRSLPLC